MKKSSFASFVFAVLNLVFLLSCTSVSNNNADDSSSSYGTPSGYDTPSSSSYGTPVYRQFDSVTIGSQTWMAENLHYAASGSKCYNNYPENCEKYGHLYDWATAMDLPTICNFSDCAGQIQPEHRGICPEGWHIPSTAEWDALLASVGGRSAAGRYLKAREGWSSCGPSGSGESYLCEDIYGFAALPGGDGFYNGSFANVGNNGYWWSVSEHNSSYAYYGEMDYGKELVSLSNYSGKEFLFSLRCVRNSNYGYGEPVYRQFDSVTIGSQTWMAENLHYAAPGSKCYNDYFENCEKYGHLYDWATAMDLPASCNSSDCADQIQPKHRGICPEGWHVPSAAEWDALFAFVGGRSTAGRYLKADEGWSSCGPLGSGGSYLCEDMYGFSALPGGIGFSNGSFRYVGSNGYWWSASEYNSPYAYYGDIAHSRGEVLLGNFGKIALFSLRCVWDSSSSKPVYRQFDSVTIGSQTWMAENLHYAVPGSKCYNNYLENCEKYGHLYDWATAMDLPASCNSSDCTDQINPKHRGICPEGWHVPSAEEWDALFASVGGRSAAGRYLKADEGWSSCGPLGSGENYLCENMYDFSALPGGIGFSNGNFSYVGNNGYWWSASEYNSPYAYYGDIAHSREEALLGNFGKIALFSLRCIQDMRQ